MAEIPTLKEAREAITVCMLAEPVTIEGEAGAAFITALTRSSPRDLVVGVCEALYAGRAGLNPAALRLCARLARFCSDEGTGWIKGTRAHDIAAAIQRDLGDRGDWPNPETDPDPKIPGRARRAGPGGESAEEEEE
jgi:hypothetical protein